ncbi:hypothetical protein FACS189421_10730 [Bacteroidia bacterium]|nr:hypothetical protein FACS189421_10730 [Bacteroidia bacterium]GHT48459.1 hypothetical protein FACS189440_12130 [Bacteroidia bacterium]
MLQNCKHILAVIAGLTRNPMLVCALVLLTSCISEDLLLNSNAPSSEGFISLSLRASESSINEDTQLWEDRVDEVRMIAFNQNGNAIYNGLLSFPNGMDNNCAAVKFNPGVYDFYFIANESAYTSSFKAALTALTNVSQFQTDTRFGQLQYNPAFVPDGASSAGRFLMSACYQGIAVANGGTEDSPNPLILPNGKVELVRSLAKVEITFRKKVPGSTISANTVSSIQLQNVANNYSVPAMDNYYTGSTAASNTITPSNFNYNNDSIGAVTFYVPEFLVQTGGSTVTTLLINHLAFPIQTDAAMAGLTAQRRSIANLSTNSVIRNYHYQIEAVVNSQGGIQLKVSVNPWNTASYTYMFQDTNQVVAIPPVTPTDSSVIVPTACGKIEIRSNNEFLQQGLQGAYGDQINWWDPNVQGPNITHGQPPYYCEKKYGPGWRLISSCELMSFLGLFDQTYKIWQSNTWQGIGSNLPLYSIPLRQQAQDLLGKLTGVDMSKYVLTDTKGGDAFGSDKLGILDDYFTPGDIMVTLKQYPNWTFPSPPFSGIENWFPMEVVNQVKGYWYSGYLDYSDPANYNKILYQQFQRYTYSSTVSRCVRSVD